MCRRLRDFGVSSTVSVSASGSAASGAAFGFARERLGFAAAFCSSGVKAPTDSEVGASSTSSTSGSTTVARGARLAPSTGETLIVMWQVRFLIRATRPRACGLKRLMIRPSSTSASET